MPATHYVLVSNATQEYFRAVLHGEFFWTSHALLASKYDFATGATLAAITLGLSKVVSVKPIHFG